MTRNLKKKKRGQILHTLSHMLLESLIIATKKMQRRMKMTRPETL